jgi:hypothetical protein
MQGVRLVGVEESTGALAAGPAPAASPRATCGVVCVCGGVEDGFRAKQGVGGVSRRDSQPLTTLLHPWQQFNRVQVTDCLKAGAPWLLATPSPLCLQLVVCQCQQAAPILGIQRRHTRLQLLQATGKQQATRESASKS